MQTKVTTLLISLTMLLNGCASVSSRAGFEDVRRDVRERTNRTVHWKGGTAEDSAVERNIAETLARPMTADDAVEIALLNNARLQASYEELGVRQAEVVQAGLLRNPIFNADLRFNNGLNAELDLVQNFLDVFYIPLRTRIAEDMFEATKLRVASQVMDLALDTRTAFYEYQSANEETAMLRRVVQATEASFTFAERLHTAGNINDLDLANERALYERSKLDLEEAELEARQKGEKVNLLLGLWGKDRTWKAVERLPEPTGHEPPAGELEKRAIATSLDLLLLKNQMQIAARQAGLAAPLSMIPEAEFGVAAERETDGTWAVGPAFSLPILIFNWQRFSPGSKFHN